MNDNTYHAEELGLRGASAMTGFLMGAVLGAGIALLLAPATGTDTRRRLSDVARKVRDTASDRLGSVRESLHDLKGDAESAIAGGREAYRDSRSSHVSATNPGL